MLVIIQTVLHCSLCPLIAGGSQRLMPESTNIIYKNKINLQFSCIFAFLGAFKVEMRRSDTKDRTIDVRYNPNESGEYAIQVKWSDKHVPGSPFIVKVVENREELHALKRDMANGRQSSKDMTNGWSEEI